MSNLTDYQKAKLRKAVQHIVDADILIDDAFPTPQGDREEELTAACSVLNQMIADML